LAAQFLYRLIDGVIRGEAIFANYVDVFKHHGVDMLQLMIRDGVTLRA
jgi:hypothetical protein